MTDPYTPAIRAAGHALIIATDVYQRVARTGWRFRSERIDYCSPWFGTLAELYAHLQACGKHTEPRAEWEARHDPAAGAHLGAAQLCGWAGGRRDDSTGGGGCRATGEPLKADIIRHRWGRIKQAASVSTTIHGLRHTALTILALDGVPENVRMALGGHATEDMARLYANHATIEDVRKAIG